MILKNNIKYPSLKNIILLIILLSNTAVLSQSSKILSFPENESIIETKFERISTEQGLSNNNIRSINQDNEGFVWIATSLGLNKYDGKIKKPFYNAENDSFSISDNKIDEVYKDSDGTIWMSTMSGELIKYDNEYERFVNFKLLENTIGKDWFTSIIDDGKGNLILGSSTGLHLFDKKNHSISFMLGKKNLNGNMNPYGITFLLRDRRSQIWVGTAYFGIFILDSNNNIIKHFQHDSTDNASLSNNQIRNIFLDSNNKIWIGTQNGLNLYNEGSDNFYVYKNEPGNSKSISHNNITSICEDKNNVLWIGTRRGGLNKFVSPDNFINFKNDAGDVNSLSNDHIDNMFVDNSNVLWIGTFGGGVSTLDCQRKKFFLISKLFKTAGNNFQNSIGTINADSFGSILVTVRFSDGIFKFGKKNNNELYYKGYEFISNAITESVITNLINYKISNLWIATFFGELIEFDTDKKSIKYFLKKEKYRFNVMCIRGNFLYLGAENRGMLKFDINRKEFVTMDSALTDVMGLNIVHLLIDKEINLWICTDLKGLYKYEFDKGSLTNFKFEDNNLNSISDNNLISVYEDSKNNIWVCSNSRGLNRYNKAGNNFTRYGSEAGLPDYIAGIQEDNNGLLWVISYDGLYKFDPEKIITSKYDNSDGLQRYDFGSDVCYKDQDGLLYFGGSNGLTYFNPEEIKDNPYIPNIVITDFQIFNESVKPSPENPFLKKNITAAKEITLSYKESVFSFEFAALIYNNPSKNQYAYIMEGFDKDWVYCGTRRNVTYTNLDPGEYTFRVKGSNNDAIWNEEGTSIKITITPPWWQTWWFKSCGAAFIFLTAGYGYKKRVSKLKEDKTVQEEFSRRLIESQEDERKRIASELHDTIAHDILLTKSKALLALRDPDDNENLKNALNEISDMSSETINDVRGISYNLHPHQLERLGFSEAIESIVKDVSKASEIDFEVEVDNVDDVITKEGEINLYRVIQEGINNIIKHSKATEAELKVIRLENHIIISISDNGRGINSSNESSKSGKHGFGLSGIAERVKILKGEFKIESEVNKGTVLRISVPFKNDKTK